MIDPRLGDVDKRSNMVFGLRKRQIVRRMTQQKYLRSFDISQQNSIVIIHPWTRVNLKHLVRQLMC